jgi:ferritin heavy chain
MDSRGKHTLLSLFEESRGISSIVTAYRLWERSAAECLADFKWLEKYLVSRGGRSKPTAIEATKFEWPDNPVEPVGPCKEALFMEKSLLEDLQRLCSLADKSGDIALRDVIQSRFIRKETKHVKDLADLLQQVVRVSKQPGLGLYLLDKELRHTDGIVPWDSLDDPSQQHHGTTEI